MNKILVTGANGQLGNELRALATSMPNVQYVFHDIDTLDLTDFTSVQNYIEKEKFLFVINCAAYTAVDKAEKEEDKALLLNSEVVRNLGNACLKNNAYLIHVSTDYVFDGSKNMPYKEAESINPQSAYGRTKSQGEQNLKDNPNAIIIRTSWLYSSFGNNFVKTILRLSQEREKLGIVYDQTGTPTYARDLAIAINTIITKVINKEQEFISGVYHYSNEGVTSWYDFAYEIAKAANSACKISPIETTEYPLPAKRPVYSVLSKTKIKETYGIIPPYWKESLADCLQKLL